MKKLILTSVSLLVGLSAAFAEPEVSGPPAELENHLPTKSRTVFLTDEAKVQVPVERGIATLRTVSENRSLSVVIHQNRELRNRLTAQLQKAGITGTNISSSRFSSSPNRWKPLSVAVAPTWKSCAKPRQRKPSKARSSFSEI